MAIKYIVTYFITSNITTYSSAINFINYKYIFNYFLMI